VRPPQVSTSRSQHINDIPEEIYRLARRLENEDMAKAAELYQQVIEREGQSWPLSAKAQERLEALLGKGKFGNRIESLLNGVWREATEPKNLICMGGATALGLAGRALALGRGGARFLPAFAEWAVEVPAFTALGRAYDAVHSPKNLMPIPIGQELAGTALALGFMKGLSAGGGSLHRKIHDMGTNGLASRWPQYARLSGAGISLSSYVLSLSALRGLETVSGQRIAPESFGEFGFDLLAEAMKFSLGAHFGRRVFQRRLAQLELEEAQLRRPFPKSTDGILHHPLGGSFTEIGGSVPTLLSLRLKPEALVEKPRGQVLLISGAGGNHTSFGEIPRRLSDENWQVRMLVYPGYQNPSDPRPLAGGGLKSHRLAKIWQESMRHSVRDIVEKHKDGPLLLGGFSMGGAGVLDAFHSLPPTVRRKVDGLILAAPAVYPKTLDAPNPAVNFLVRRLALPAMALFGVNLRKKQSGLHPRAEGRVDVAMTVPRTANHAAVLTIEGGRRAARSLAKEGRMPPILLIHGGENDLTVSARSAEQLKKWFGKSIVREILMPKEDGHYVLVGGNHSQAEDAVSLFASRRALLKEGE